MRNFMKLVVTFLSLTLVLFFFIIIWPFFVIPVIGIHATVYGLLILFLIVVIDYLIKSFK